ncbi:MAG: HAD family hydrolase [Roseovarius sp.]
MNEPVTKLDGLLFDKDGTLFDFHATWSVWAAELIVTLSEGDPALAEALARGLEFDLETGQFRPGSPAIASPNRVVAECVAGALGRSDVDKVEDLLDFHARQAPLSPAVPLVPLLEGLRDQGLVLGVMTNDSEATAHAHLRSAGVDRLFDFVAGYDSGFGAKPDPGPLLAFAEAHGLVPARVAMVGDSTHDLLAGRAAGMQTLAVLTGAAGAAELSPFADHVLTDIGEIPAWLAA